MVNKMFNYSNLEKSEFAKLLLMFPGEPFKAAMELYPNDAGRALYLATQLINDPFIIDEIERLKEENFELTLMPSKLDLLKKVWGRLDNKFLDTDSFCKLARLYSELQGYIIGAKDDEKPKRKLTEAEIDSKFTQLLNELNAM